MTKQKNKKMQRRVKKVAKTSECTFLRALLISLPVQIIVGMVFLLASSKLLLMIEDPSGFVIPASLLCVGASAFAGGFSSVKMRKNSWMLMGFSMGAVLLFLSFVISLTPLYIPSDSIVLRAALTGVMFVFSLIGARLGMPQNNTRRKYVGA